MSFAPKGKSLTNLPPAVAAPLLPSSRKSFEANSLIEEREQLSHLQQAQKKRAAELDALRLKLENRAIEIEKVQNKVEERSAALYASQSALDSERRRLAVEFDHKVTELADARDRLEAQVAHMELKEAQLHEAFVRLEKESKEKEHSDALNRAQLAAAWARFEAEKANAVSEAETHLATLASALAASLGVDNADLGFGPATSTPAAAILASARKFAAAARLPFSPQPFGSADLGDIAMTKSNIVLGFDDISVPDESELLALADRVVAEAVAADAAAAEATEKLTSPSPNPSSFLSPLKDAPIAHDPQRSLPFGSPSIPAKIQAVRLKTTLQELSKRTGQISAAANVLKEKELKLDERAAQLESREGEIQALLERVEALSEREQSLKATVSSLQAQVAEQQLAASVALSPRHVTHAAKEQAWKNSLRSDSVFGHNDIPSSPVAGGQPVSSFSSQSQTSLSPAPLPLVTTLPPGTPGSILAIRVENELREKVFQDRERTLTEKEASIEAQRLNIAEETKKAKENIAVMQKRSAAEAAALAQAGRAEIESLRREAIEEAQRNKVDILAEKEQLNVDRRALELARQAFNKVKEDVLKMQDDNQRLQASLEEQLAVLRSDKIKFEAFCKARNDELSARDASLLSMSETLALKREEVQNSGASALQDVMIARTSLENDRIVFEKERLETQKAKNDLSIAISETADAARILEDDKKRFLADLQEREERLAQMESSIREKEKIIKQSELDAQSRSFEADMALQAREAAVREAEISAASKASESQRFFDEEVSRRVNAEMTSREEKITDLKSEISALKSALSKAEDSQSQNVSSMINAQESSAASIRAQMGVLSSRASSLDQRENELLAQSRSLESRSADLKRRFDEIEAASVAQARKAAQLSASHDDLLARRSALENRVKEVREEALRRDKALAEREKVLSSQSDFNGKVDELVIRCSTLESMKSQLEANNANLQAAFNSLNDEVMRLQKFNSSLQAEVSSLVTRLEQSHAESERLQSLKISAVPVSVSHTQDSAISSVLNPFDSPQSKVSFPAQPSRSTFVTETISSTKTFEVVLPSDSKTAVSDALSEPESRNAFSSNTVMKINPTLSELEGSNGTTLVASLPPSVASLSIGGSGGLPPALPRARALSRSTSQSETSSTSGSIEVTQVSAVSSSAFDPKGEEIVVCSLCHARIPLSQTRIHSDSCFIVGASTPILHSRDSSGSSIGKDVENLSKNVVSERRPSFIRNISKGFGDVMTHSPIRRESGSNGTATMTPSGGAPGALLGRIKSLGSGLRSRTNSFISHAVHDVQEALHSQPNSVAIEPRSAEEEWGNTVLRLDDFAKGKV